MKRILAVLVFGILLPLISCGQGTTPGLMPNNTTVCNVTGVTALGTPCQGLTVTTLTFVTAANDGLNDQTAVTGSMATYWTSSGPAIVHRVNRLLVGPAASDGTGCPSVPNSWMNSLSGGSCDLANIVVDATSFDGIQAGGRTSVTCAAGIGCPSGGSAGAYLFGYNDNNTQGNIALGLNGVGFAATGTKGIVLGAQQDVDTAAVPGCVTHPGNTLCATGSTAIGLLVTPGAFPGIATQNPNAAIVVNIGGPSNTKFTKGIMFASGVLDSAQGSGGRGIAMEVMPGQTLRWFDGTTAFAEIGTGSSGTFGLLTNSSQWSINGVATVSCAAGTVSTATMVVTNGIITHC